MQCAHFSFALLGPHRVFLDLTECAHVHEFRKTFTEWVYSISKNRFVTPECTGTRTGTPRNSLIWCMRAWINQKLVTQAALYEKTPTIILSVFSAHANDVLLDFSAVLLSRCQNCKMHFVEDIISWQPAKTVWQNMQMRALTGARNVGLFRYSMRYAMSNFVHNH